MDKEDVVHIYKWQVGYYSAIKKNEMTPFGMTWMELEVIVVSEVRQRKTNTTWYHVHV